MLGTLEQITDLRSVWKHEALDFTRWLAQEENLAMLGEEIGVEISLIKTEANVGGFNVDVLAEEERTGRKIVIENQLEVSDHDHLGKTLTYASGYDAEIIIWVLKDIREEHLQAVTWLNENTNDKINFFVVKIELWKISESPVAVKFNVVARPNGWTKTLRRSIDGNYTETQLLQLDYWNAFKTHALNAGTTLRLSKAMPQQWYDIAYGVSGSRISLTVNSHKKVIGAGIYIDDSKDVYWRCFNHKEEIERAMGTPLEWMELPTKKASRIKLTKEADFLNRRDWTRQFNWIKQHAELFAETFIKYVK